MSRKPKAVASLVEKLPRELPDNLRTMFEQVGKLFAALSTAEQCEALRLMLPTFEYDDEVNQKVAQLREQHALEACSLYYGLFKEEKHLRDGRNRPRDPVTIQLIAEVRHLKLGLRLSWSKVTRRILDEFPQLLPAGGCRKDPAKAQKHIEKQYRRVVEGKKS